MFAIGGLYQGGSQKQLTELAVRLPADQFEPVVVTNHGEPVQDHVRRLQAARVTILTIGQPEGGPARRWARTAYRYVQVLRVLQPDVVYPWLDETAAFLAPICRAMGIPCLVARRNMVGSAREREQPLIGRWARRAESQALLATANSRAVARDCAARGHKADRVRIIPNGHEDLPPLPTPTTQPVTFGYVAQFRPEKGHHRLLDALERLPAGNWRVDLAGDGPLRPELEQRTAQTGLRDRVRFIGPVSDIRAFWRERHVAVLLSDAEGSPNALLEAAFAGRPAIATESGGSPEVVDGGGILVPVDDPRPAAKALGRLVADACERERLGQEGWRHVAQSYSMDRMVEGHVSAIREALELAGARRRPRKAHGSATLG